MKSFLQFQQHQKALLIWVGFNLSLIGFRIVYLESIVFGFLIWNLLLAGMPLLFIWLGEKAEKADFKWLSWISLAVAVLFLPNAPYIVTDLFHLRWSGSAPIWFDTLMVFSFALTGLILFYICLIRFEEILLRRLKSIFQPFYIPLLIFLSAFGIYLGRFVRFNSWDIVTQPSTLFYEMSARIFNPMEHPETWAVTLAYGGFFLVGYYFVKQLRFQPLK